MHRILAMDFGALRTQQCSAEDSGRYNSAAGEAYNTAGHASPTSFLLRMPGLKMLALIDRS